MVEKKNPELFDANPELKTDFTFIQTLGEGGMGQVYLARQKKLNRLVAIKTLLPSKLSDDKELERLKREATALSRLNHPNLVDIYSVIKWEGLIYIVTEYAEGKSLRECLKAGPIPLADSFFIIESICNTLGYVHSMGLVHRDIKPDNILVEKGMKVRVIDFGLAKQYDKSTMYENITKEGECIGTPTYMSPEALRGRSLGPTCDIYALGILFYELITQAPPLSGDAIQIARAHMESEIPLISEIVLNVSEKTDDFFCTCLAVDPGERFDSMESMARAMVKIKTDILAIDVSRAPLHSKGNEISNQRTIASRHMEKGGRGFLPPKPRQIATIKSRNATKTVNQSKINSCKIPTNVKSEKNSSNRKRLTIAFIAVAFILLGIGLFYGATGSKNDDTLRFPAELKYSQRKAGSITLSWDENNSDFSSIIIEDTETGKTETVEIKDHKVSLTNLKAGRKYKFAFLSNNKQKTIFKALTGPLSALEISALTPPESFNGVGSISFKTLDDISVSCSYKQDGQQVETDLSDTLSRTHVFEYKPSKGPFSELSLTATDSAGTSYSIMIPSSDLAKHCMEALENLNGKNIALACEKLLKPECFGNVTCEQRAEKYKSFIFRLYPDFKNYLLIYPLLPTILLDDQDYTLELKQKIFTLMDMDIISLTYGASSMPSVDAIMFGNLQKITEENHNLYFGRLPVNTIYPLFDYTNADKDLECHQLIWPSDLPESDSGKIRQKLLKMTYTRFEWSEFKTIKVKLDASALNGIKSAAVEIKTPLFRESFKLLLEINGHPPIPFLSPLSVFSEKRAEDPDKEHVKIIFVSRQVPLEYLKVGENSFKIYVSAPLGIPSAMVPSLKTGTLSLQKSN
jgi:serine/threonine protein kinase